MLEAVHSNLPTVSPVGGTGHCASASHPDISFILFESSLYPLSHHTPQHSPLAPPHPFISGHAIPLLDETGFWGGGKKKRVGIGRSSQITPYIIFPTKADYFSCMHEARKQRFITDITLSASTLPGVTLGLSSKLSHTSWMVNCEMSKTVLGKLL